MIVSICVLFACVLSKALANACGSHTVWLKSHDATQRYFLAVVHILSHFGLVGPANCMSHKELVDCKPEPLSAIVPVQ